MESHFPSSAELAAFRQSITRGLAIEWLHPGQKLGDQAYQGAWPEEIQHGIGYSASDPESLPSRGPIPARMVSDSRREASRMRSAAMARGAWALSDLEAFSPARDMHRAVSDTHDYYPDA